MENDKKHFSPKRIAVMKGGWSGERTVSLKSASEIITTFEQASYECCVIDVTRNITQWIEQIEKFNPDVIFMNALHGEWVEDGCMQGVLEALGYPYTGSDVTASALAMNKDWSRRLFSYAGLPIASGTTVDVKQPIDMDQFNQFPYIIKPIDQGSSLGVSIIKNITELKERVANWGYGKYALIEQYIAGRELSVAIRGMQALGVAEPVPHSGFYDYESKYTIGETDYYIPARIDPEISQQACHLALSAVQALGIKGISRVDFRFDDINYDPGKLYILEVNSLPGMTKLSLLPEIAKYNKISFLELLEWMLHNPIWPKTNFTPSRNV